MRPSHVLAIFGSVASAQAATTQTFGNWQTTVTVSICDSAPTATTPYTDGNSTSSYLASSYANSSSASTTTVGVPTATPEVPPPGPSEAGGGTIPPQMKGSMVGLLGFFIVGLVVL
ncbi:hypothetical protein N3K66_002555 [Trichothecium roseum]|uniref:Uncharacterized protein n=1 Tax=Trichothecium roseum TaxID=47278 RepID=A0ACC0VCL6_9HYPO|nr:hypothetical protein N3K66_002555 [Trichothecium roseum]